MSRSLNGFANNGATLNTNPNQGLVNNSGVNLSGLKVQGPSTTQQVPNGLTGGGTITQPIPGLISPHPTVQPTTAPKKVTTTDTAGNVTSTEYHKPEPTTTPTPAPNSQSGGTTTKINPDGNPYGSTPGMVGNQQQNAQAVINSAQDNNKVDYYSNKAVQATELNNINSLSRYAESQFYGQPGQQIAPDLAAPDLAGRAAGTSGLASNLGNIFGSAAQTGLTNALADRSQKIGAAENVLSAGQPTQVSPGNTTVSPFTNKGLYGLGTENGGNAYQNFSNLQFNTATGQALGKQASDLQTATNQTDANFQTLKNTTDKYGINLSQFPDINSLQQFIQNKGGGAGGLAAFNEAYNALQTSIGQIINTSGAFTPSEVGNLTAQMSAAKLNPAQMQQLYDTVRQTAATKVNTILNQAKSYEGSGTNSVAGNMPNASGSPISLDSKTQINGHNYVKVAGGWKLAD